NLGVPALRHKNVRGFYVAMNDPLGVRGIERIGNVDGNLNHLIEIERMRSNQVLQRRAFQILHSNKARAVVLANFVNRANVRMIQRGSRSGLAPEALQRVWVLRQIFGKKLDGYEASKLKVFGLEHDTHAAATDFLDNSVM